jgi:hypothetical protein
VLDLLTRKIVILAITTSLQTFRAVFASSSVIRFCANKFKKFFDLPELSSLLSNIFEKKARNHRMESPAANGTSI